MKYRVKVWYVEPSDHIERHSEEYTVNEAKLAAFIDDVKANGLLIEPSADRYFGCWIPACAITGMGIEVKK